MSRGGRYLLCELAVLARWPLWPVLAVMCRTEWLFWPVSLAVMSRTGRYVPCGMSRVGRGLPYGVAALARIGGRYEP